MKDMKSDINGMKNPINGIKGEQKNLINDLIKSRRIYLFFCKTIFQQLQCIIEFQKKNNLFFIKGLFFTVLGLTIDS